MIGIEDKYKRVFEHFGLDKQLDKLDEEVEEFEDEIFNFADTQEKTFDDLEYECADVINVMLGFVIAAGGSVESVIAKATEKMVRTEKRIASNYYK